MNAIPEDLKAIAEQIVRDYGHDPDGLLIGAIAAAVYSERERCAKIAEDFSWVLPMFESREVNEATDDAACAVQEQIAAAIRGEPHHG